MKRLYVIAAAIVVLGIISALAVWVYDPADKEKWLFGTVGVLPFITTLGTVLFVAVNATMTQRQTKIAFDNSRIAAEQAETARRQIEIAQSNLANTTAMLQHSLKAEVSTRFQRASELLNSESVATKVAGVMLLNDIALDDPERYYNVVLNLLIVFAEHETQPAWSAIDKLKTINSGEQEHKNPSLWAEAFTRTPEDVLAAVRSVGQIRDLKDSDKYENRWLGGQRLRLKRVVLVDQTITGGNFSRMQIEDGFLVDMKFVDSAFNASTINNATIIETTFASCSMRDATIRTSAKIDVPHGKDRRLSFLSETDLRGAEVLTKSEKVIASHFKRYDGEKVFGSIDQTESADAWEKRHNIGSPIEIAPAPLSGGSR